MICAGGAPSSTWCRAGRARKRRARTSTSPSRVAEERQPLAVRRGGLEQLPHHGQETQVGHLVGFIQHADLDISEVAVALPDQVGQAPGQGYDDIGAVAQSSHLRPLRGAAEDRRDGESQASGDRTAWTWVASAGGHQHQAARAARPCLPRPAWQPAGGRKPASCPSRSGRVQESKAGQGIGQRGRTGSDVGVVMPSSARTATRAAATPRAANVPPAAGSGPALRPRAPGPGRPQGRASGQAYGLFSGQG